MMTKKEIIFYLSTYKRKSRPTFIIDLSRTISKGKEFPKESIEFHLPENYFKMTKQERLIIRAHWITVNNQRKKVGLPTLKLDGTLKKDEQAAIHSAARRKLWEKRKADPEWMAAFRKRASEKSTASAVSRGLKIREVKKKNS